MAIPVTKVMYQALIDGSLHETKEEAENYDKYYQKVSLEDKIIDVLEPTVCVKHHFSTLSGRHGFIPYNGNEWENTRTERERFMRELAELIIDKWEDLQKTMENENSHS